MHPHHYYRSADTKTVMTEVFTVIMARAVVNYAALKLADAPYETLLRHKCECQRFIAGCIAERQNRSRRLARRASMLAIPPYSALVYGPHPRNEHFEEYIDYLVLKAMREVRAIKYLLAERCRMMANLYPMPDAVRAHRFLCNVRPKVEDFADSPIVMVQSYEAAKRAEELMRPVLYTLPRDTAWAIETILDDAATAPDKSWQY
jgi:hypothetical protein